MTCPICSLPVHAPGEHNPEEARCSGHKKMTEIHALKKARELWGPGAMVYKKMCCSREDFIKRNPHSKPDFWERFFGKMRFVVGCEMWPGFGMEIKGDGLSWDEAFAKAEAKQ